MITFVQKTSEWIFYILGTGFFIAYLLYSNEMLAPWPKLWMSIGDLPLLLIGMIYGGISLYTSISNPEKTSKALILIISIPLIALFSLFVVMNFWAIF